MEFNSKQEDIYEKLVGKSKYGKEVQVKYELTRPRKKQKKKSDTTRFEIVQQLNKQEAHKPASEEVYSVPPDDDHLEDDEDFINDSIDDESVEAPPPPPRSDSLLPSETGSLSSNDLYQEVSDNVQNASNLYQEVTSTQSNTSQLDTNDKDESIYAPRNWRQQNYESWTPFFKSAPIDDPPPPTKAPPKPPVIKVSSNTAPSENVQKDKSRRERGYETWTPLASGEPPPPTQQPPKPPGHSSPKTLKHQITSSNSSPQPVRSLAQATSIQATSQIVHGAALIPATQPAVQNSQQPPIYSQSTKRQFLSTPKQITGLKKMGQPTPFLAAQSQDEPRKPSRPAPKPPVAKPHVITETKYPDEDCDIRLSPIQDSLPSPGPRITMELEDQDTDRLYEPRNWRRQLKDSYAEEVYGVTGDMTDILPPPPEPEPLGGSLAFARAPLRKSKSILKKPADGGEKKKKVRMLFPSDTVTPI